MGRFDFNCNIFLIEQQYLSGKKFSSMHDWIFLAAQLCNLFSCTRFKVSYFTQISFETKDIEFVNLLCSLMTFLVLKSFNLFLPLWVIKRTKFLVMFIPARFACKHLFTTKVRLMGRVA